MTFIQLSISLILIFGSLFILSLVLEASDINISKSMYPDYYNKIDKKEKERYLK